MSTPREVLADAIRYEKKAAASPAWIGELQLASDQVRALESASLGARDVLRDLAAGRRHSPANARRQLERLEHALLPFTALES